MGITVKWKQTVLQKDIYVDNSSVFHAVSSWILFSFRLIIGKISQNPIKGKLQGVFI